MRYGQTLGFDFRVEKYRRHTHTARLYGSASDRGQFFGVVRQDLQATTDACLGSGIDWTRSPVMALEALGPRDLIYIQTSTATFFANGIATHNCYAEALGSRQGQHDFSTGAAVAGNGALWLRDAPLQLYSSH